MNKIAQMAQKALQQCHYLEEQIWSQKVHAAWKLWKKKSKLKVQNSAVGIIYHHSVLPTEEDEGLDESILATQGSSGSGTAESTELRML